MVEEDDSSKMVTDTTEAVEVKSDKVVVPPLVGAARRLERLLAVDKVLDFYTNPCKVVRRWLGTSSGAAADATAADIQAAAYQLLDSSPSAATTVGRALLTAGYHPPAATTTTAAAEETTSAMETDEDSSQISKKEGDPSLVTTTYLTLASAREVESWLVSLAVRLLWKEGKHVQALDLAQKGIDILMRHLEVGSSMTSSSSSFFPLLARLYRWRSLVAESLPTTTIVTVASMAQAHNLATLRRDVDTQATLLNSMLRDLLRHSQGTLICCVRFGIKCTTCLTLHGNPIHALDA